MPVSTSWAGHEAKPQLDASDEAPAEERLTAACVAGERRVVPHVAVTAVGIDRPGIVAAVTKVLMDHGGNLEDTAMTRLGGHFAMVLVVEVPGDEDAAALEHALGAEGGPLGLSVTIRHIADVADPHDAGEAWSVSMHGADRPGIVHRVTALLADAGANIVDLSTRRIDTDAGTGYVVLAEVLLPPATDPAVLQRDLEALARELGVDVHLAPDEADLL
jgi:glycine cleavage system transcriptional repressor